MDWTMDRMADFLAVLCENDVIDFATSTYGWKKETLEDILYWATGYRTFDQAREEMDIWDY